MKKLMLALMGGFIIIALISTSCKKEDTIDETTPVPTNLKNYTGATADYAQPVSFTTGEMAGEIWLVSFSITAQYIDTAQSKTYIQTYSEQITSGIKKFSSNAIELDTGTGLTFTATIKDSGKYIDGTYNYNYTGTMVHSADFATDKQ
jgi:hypothetical protein